MSYRVVKNLPEGYKPVDKQTFLLLSDAIEHCNECAEKTKGIGMVVVDSSGGVAYDTFVRKPPNPPKPKKAKQAKKVKKKKARK